MTADTNTSAAGALVLVLMLAGGAAFYLLPTIVAAVRKVPNVGSVAVLNILLGWTLIGWAVALAMAARSVPSSITVNVGTATIAAAGWHPDPSGRHQLRHWDGQRWGPHVSDNGATSIDPL